MPNAPASSHALAAPARAVRDGSWLTLERIGAYAVILILAYAAFLIWLVATSNALLDAWGRPLGTDFANIYATGRLVWAGRAADAYDLALLKPWQQALFGLDPDLFWGWHYPPMFLAVAAPLAALPYLAALTVWLVATGALYLGAVRRALPEPHAQIVLAVALAYPAVFANVTHGHNGFLSAALFGYGLLLLGSRPVLAGALLGLLAYKPQYGLLLPVALVAAGHWRAIAGATCSVLVSALASVALFGIESWTAFLAHAGLTQSLVLEQGAPGWAKLQGVFPTVRMLGGGVQLAYAAQFATMAAMGLVVWWLWRGHASHRQASAGLLLATMLATPYAFNYDSMILGVAIALLVAEGLQRGFAPYERSALALLWLVPLFSRELAATLHLPIATIAQALVLALLVARCRASARVTTSEPALA